MIRIEIVNQPLPRCKPLCFESLKYAKLSLQPRVMVIAANRHRGQLLLTQSEKTALGTVREVSSHVQTDALLIDFL